MGVFSHPRKLTLYQKLVLWSFVPTAIILVVVALVAFAAYQKVTEDRAVERDRDLTRLLADQRASSCRRRSRRSRMLPERATYTRAIETPSWRRFVAPGGRFPSLTRAWSCSTIGVRCCGLSPQGPNQPASMGASAAGIERGIGRVGALRRERRSHF